MTENLRPKKITDDGYEVIGEDSTPKGMQCGKCGMKFDYGKAYAYWCPRSGCPVQRT